LPEIELAGGSSFARRCCFPRLHHLVAASYQSGYKGGPGDDKTWQDGPGEVKRGSVVYAIAMILQIRRAHGQVIFVLNTQLNCRCAFSKCACMLSEKFHFIIMPGIYPSKS
jgi:hypothetical protein